MVHAQAQEWKDKHHAATADPSHRRAISALTDLIDGKSSPAETAGAVTGAYEEWLLASAESNRKDEDKITAFWAVYMCNAIRSFGDAAAREHLIDLLVEISRRPDVKKSDGSVRKGPDDQTFWRDLPMWSFCFAEYGLQYDDPIDFAADETDEYYAQAPSILNATRFAATVLERGAVTCRLPAEADLFLERGLEQSYDEAGKHVREWQVLLPPVATWLIIAARVFHKLCLGEAGPPTREQSRPGRNKWDGRTWSMARWALWKDNLRKFADRRDFNDECRRSAGQALEKMVEVETEYQK